MTWGIDVSGYQDPMDFVLAKSQGMEFCIVKASGYNTGSLYVANGYKNHIDKLVQLSGVGIGHYYVPGRITSGKSVIDQANYFVDNLYRYEKSHVLALDNEPLDSNATYWNQDDCLAWFTQVQARLGNQWNKFWLYCPAALTRQYAPWDKITNTATMIWWSAYGDRPTGRLPDHTPSLQGKIARWDIHQYSSSVPIAGKATIDANFSNHTWNELFGGAQTVTLQDKARAYAALYPKPSTGEPSWDQMCGNLMFRFGAYTTPGWSPSLTGPNAWNVGLASGPMNGNAGSAPPGAIHWWKNNNSTGMPGHVGVDLTGGGQNVFMATYAVRESLGNAIGIQSVGGYSSAKPFMLYQGWTNNYAGARFNTSGTAGLDGTPINNEDLGDIMARYLWAPNRGGILITETEGVFFPATTDANLANEMRILQKKLFNGIDVGTREWDVARQDAIDRMVTTDKNDAAALKAAGVGGGVVDNAAIIAAINAAIDEALSDVTIDPGDVVIDVDAIARKVRAEFAANPLK